MSPWASPINPEQTCATEAVSYLFKGGATILPPHHSRFETSRKNSMISSCGFAALQQNRFIPRQRTITLTNFTR